MTYANVMGRARRFVEKNMLDTCTLQRVVGRIKDPVTALPTPVYEDVYAGRCKVQTFEPSEREPEVGGARPTIQRYSVHLPVGSCKPAIGDIITLLTSALDPEAAGRQFRVVALLHKTAATAYRLNVEEVTDHG